MDQSCCAKGTWSHRRYLAWQLSHQGEQVASAGAGIDDADAHDVHLPQRRVGRGKNVVWYEVRCCTDQGREVAMEVHRQEERPPTTDTHATQVTWKVGP